LLLEKERLPRHKVCGEFVSPESLRLLDSLLSKDLFASHPQITGARIFLDHKSVSLPLARAARSIPRHELDAALLESAREAGVRTEECVTVREVDQTEVINAGLFKVKTDGAAFSSRAVVNATGRWSQLTRHSPSAGETRWIGLKAHFREASPPDSVDLYFFAGGYCGVQKVGKDAVNAAAMVQAGVGRSLEDVFGAHPELLRRSRDWALLFPAIATSPLYFRTPDTSDGCMLRAGDAAGFIDPFAGDGISLALHSGSLAGGALARFFSHQCSLAQAQGEYGMAYRKRFAPAFRNAARLRTLLTAPSWIRSSLLGLVGTRPIAGLIVHATRARTS
jgi:flavin-dependent dehydrogenase